jgi:Adenylate cyclase, family 3 (some proteins contain HAMP domain)
VAGRTKAAVVVAEIRYAQSESAYVAYQVLGEGPRDLLVVMDGFIPVDTMDDEPRLARAMGRLASFARVIRFDRRGIGLSDPVAPSDPPTLEQWVDDALAVLDAVGSASTVVLASGEATPVGLLLAASHPDRLNALVIVNGFARALVDVDYPEGVSAEFIEQMLDSTDPTPADPSVDWIAAFAPSAAGDEGFRDWWTQTGRRGASPATARALLRVLLESDVRAVLPTIQVPTLVAHFADHSSIKFGRYIAEHVPRADFVAIPGADDYWWSADGASAVLDEIEEFLTGMRSGPAFDRVLSTVLFTDIVASTTRASDLGDRGWRDLLDRHDAAVRRQISRFRGREVKTTGDGFLATFDGPARAVECACAIRDVAEQLDLPVRSGVHTGEIEIRGDDIGGIAVHIAARVAARAESSTVWVSRTVTDLVVGSGLRFVDRGDHELKGVPGTWHLFAVQD